MRARGAFHDKCGCHASMADPQVLVDALTLTLRSSPAFRSGLVNVSTLVLPAYGCRSLSREVR